MYSTLKNATLCVAIAALGTLFMLYITVSNPDRKDAHWGKRKMARDR